jgi:phosphohistidine swiveling domain-containing protein
MSNKNGYDPVTGTWNDSLTGDYLWSRNNFGEGRPDVMAPFTFSVTDKVWRTISILPGYSMAGNICGRFYANVSVSMTMLTTLGKSVEAAKEQMAGMLGNVPEELEIPQVSLRRSTMLLAMPKMIRLAMREKAGTKLVPEYLETMPGLCKALRKRIKDTTAKPELIDIWHNEIFSRINADIWVVAGGAAPLEALMGFKRKLVDLVGEADANTLFSGLSTEEDMLASLGPVVGMAKVAEGKMTRLEYLKKYGHRGPEEAELSLPRPAEDPDWFDKQLAEYKKNPVNVDELLNQRHAEFEAAWAKLKLRYPKQATKLRRQIDKVGPAARMREAVRDEVTRLLWVEREWALQAGKLTNLGDDIFLLTIDEILNLLSGKDTATGYIPKRNETYTRYRALPPYPMIIRGHFDPFEWAADPDRRNDIYDPTGALPLPTTKAIKGFAGAVGRVEGLVRVLDGPDQGDQFQKGEILVAVTTNVGWTPLFPRAAAVVTDVGAPLSHAAIVARELGIPAVVGTTSATTLLHTGDRVRVDGGRGVVEILNSKPKNS